MVPVSNSAQRFVAVRAVRGGWNIVPIAIVAVSMFTSLFSTPPLGLSTLLVLLLSRALVISNLFLQRTIFGAKFSFQFPLILSAVVAGDRESTAWEGRAAYSKRRSRRSREI